MKVKDLKRLINYWPDEGEVHIEGMILGEEDIHCIATDPEWREVNKIKLEDLIKTKNLFEKYASTITLDSGLKLIKSEIARLDIEIEELRKAII